MSVAYAGFPWLEQLSLVVACIAFLFLGRIFARWPRVELWLVAAAFTCLAPSIILVVLIGTDGAFDQYDAPNRIYLEVSAILLLWWAMRAKTSLLGKEDSGAGGSNRALLMFFLPVLAILLSANLFRLTHMGLAAPIVIAACQLVLVGFWWFASMKASLQASTSVDTDEIPAESLKPVLPADARNLPSANVPDAPTMGSPRPAEASPPRKPIVRDNIIIFVSYRRQDSADVTGRIYDRLVRHFDKAQVFKDVDSIPLGVDFREHLGNVVGQCDVLLAVVGDSWLAADSTGRRRVDDTKDFVRIEIEAALQRKIPVIPLLVRGASVPSENDLPASLAQLSYRNGIAVRPDPDFHRDMDRLIAGLEGHLSRRA
jgi:hypothetical protein